MSLRSKLRVVVEGTDTRAGRTFDFAVQSLIVLALASFCVETLPDLSPRVQRVLFVVEVASVLLFTAEYLLRLWVTERPLKYALSFFGLIDLLAILPFYLSRTVDLRAIRVFRLLRLVRILKLLRYSRAVRRFQAAYREIREELVLFFVATLFVVFVASIGIYYFEREAQPEQFRSVFHAMWWAVSTLTTVGYGDVYPVTVGGRIFTSVLLLVSLGVVAVPSGLFASALTREMDREAARRAASDTAPPSDRADVGPSEM